jgi:hypothetical protein
MWDRTSGLAHIIAPPLRALASTAQTKTYSSIGNTEAHSRINSAIGDGHPSPLPESMGCCSSTRVGSSHFQLCRLNTENAKVPPPIISIFFVLLFLSIVALCSGGLNEELKKQGVGFTSTFPARGRYLMSSDGLPCHPGSGTEIIDHLFSPLKDLLQSKGLNRDAIEIEECIATFESRAPALVGDFKPKDAANTLWAYAALGLQPGETLLRLLEERACNVAGEFNSREIAKTLWACGTLKVKPGHRMVILLEKQACDVLEESTPQDIAFMLWAYGTLKIEPCPRLVAALERRACAAAAGDFTPQEIANTLWM